MYQGILLEMFNIGGGEMILIMIAILLLFGGKKLPELARGLGKGIREFKDASEGVKREIHRNINSVTAEEEEKKEDYTGNPHHPVAEEQQMPGMTYGEDTNEAAKSDLEEKDKATT
ncbi:Sec-independent protein translocase protein TatA [compost metagenome]